ncbi:MAG: hypothetical protein C4524_07925 [Candidatus Zixiibacteriota bacterium]|nr:MAG: hypothetical protein C4524_07925 [candidate division Zixibacteria bacterium]
MATRFMMTVLIGLLAAGAAGAGDVRVFGDKVVEADETVTGDIIAVTGDLVIRGRVTGTCVAYVGDITLDSAAVVEGDVVARQGRIFRAPGSQVTGNLVQGSLPGVQIGRDDSPALAWEGDWESRRSLREREECCDDDHSLIGETDLKLAYNKVDGLFLGLEVEEFPFSDYGIHFRTFASGGYGFSSHSWQGRGGFGFGFLPRGQMELSVDAYHLTYTEDAWYMSDRENTLAAFFLHEDFRDYYEREGFGTTLAWNPVPAFDLSARYQAEQHHSLGNETEWALFWGSKSFRLNLPITEGMLRAFIFAAGLDTRDRDDRPECGWRLAAEMELTDPDLASDFDYTRYLLDLRRYQPLYRFVNLDTRLRLGRSEGDPPPQKLFYLGGPSSLPGFGLKEFAGTEMALWNGEIRLHDEHGRGFFDEVGLIFFADVGMTADGSLADLAARDWASDVGVGLSSASGQVRLQVAKRTDTSEDAYTWMLRIERPF